MFKLKEILTGWHPLRGGEIKRTTEQKMARRHNKEGGNHLEQESNRQKTMEDIDGGLLLQWVDKAWVKGER